MRSNQEVVGSDHWTGIIKRLLFLTFVSSRFLVPHGSVNEYSPNAPLWHNPCFCEFFHWPDGAFWTRHGVKLVPHLFSCDVFHSFSYFQQGFNFPSTSYFHYLKLQHTVAA